MDYSVFTGDQCPMHFDDGANPWIQTENYIKVFNYDYFTGGSNILKGSVIVSLVCVLIASML